MGGRCAKVIGIVAGESSGDVLGAGLMRALQARYPSVQFVGIGGEQMLAAGLETVRPMSDLNVNGFAEPIKRLPELLSIFNELAGVFKARSIDAFIGVDFNVFNLLLERRLKRLGFATVHYVSPSVYAWRRGRIRRVARAVDLLLTLFPFEPPLYSRTSVRAVCVGHPMADEIEPLSGAAAEARARQARLSLAPTADANAESQLLVALLPGSRRSEIDLMLPIFLQACQRLQARNPTVQFLLPCPRAELMPLVQAHVQQADVPVRVYQQSARTVLAACTVALIKSGTSTLEAMLLRRPMVVSYRLGKLTAMLVKRLLRSDFVALPNILAGRQLVPELMQDAATPAALAEALQRLIDGSAEGAQLGETQLEFARQHELLRRNASVQAATAIAEHLGWAS